MASKTIKVESEDIEEILLKIEKSFNIKFTTEGLKNAKTFGDFNTIILSKINVENKNDCTSQQAFYKLRTAILTEKKIDIKPDTQLADIFPRATRKQDIKTLEARLEMKLDILTPKTLIIRLLTLLVIISIIGLFIRPNLGVAGIIFSIISFELAYKLGIEFPINSVGELSNRMVKMHYSQSRRNPLTANSEEIKAQIATIFEESLGLDKNELLSDTIFDFY
jgi:acyl carrier protein